MNNVPHKKDNKAAAGYVAWFVACFFTGYYGMLALLQFLAPMFITNDPDIPDGEITIHTDHGPSTFAAIDIDESKMSEFHEKMSEFNHYQGTDFDLDDGTTHSFTNDRA